MRFAAAALTALTVLAAPVIGAPPPQACSGADCDGAPSCETVTVSDLSVLRDGATANVSVVAFTL
jgi:hypothetical protein